MCIEVCARDAIMLKLQEEGNARFSPENCQPSPKPILHNCPHYNSDVKTTQYGCISLCTGNPLSHRTDRAMLAGRCIEPITE